MRQLKVIVIILLLIAVQQGAGFIARRATPGLRALSAMVHLYHGLILSKAGRLEAAVGAFQKALPMEASKIYDAPAEGQPVLCETLTRSHDSHAKWSHAEGNAGAGSSSRL